MIIFTFLGGVSYVSKVVISREIERELRSDLFIDDLFRKMKSDAMALLGVFEYFFDGVTTSGSTTIDCPTYK